MMQYKWYFGSVHYNDEDQLFYGKLEFIRSFVSYEGKDVASLKADFEEAVDDYLSLCQEKGKIPEISSATIL
jgi:predicted HicB family RNase H-like nuclease